MDARQFVVIGAGEVGSHLARTLSVEGHRVTLVDRDPARRKWVEEQLDVGFVLGSGASLPTLEAANVAGCDLLVAASASDEVNLVASLLAKRLGAPHTVVRIASAEDLTTHWQTYEQVFEADLLLSTQLLTTTRILNQVLGYNTLEIEYMARGAIQVRRIRVEEGSLLHERPLASVKLPTGSLVLAFLSEGQLRVPDGEDRARAGEDVLVIGTREVIDEVERRISGHSRRIGLAVIAGGGATAHAVAVALRGQARTVKIIETDRDRAEALAARFPDFEIVHGDATDLSVLTEGGVGEARSFIALTGHDESNLMACLLAEELGAGQITALVQRSETSSLWHKIGLLDVVSPRTTAAQHIQAYIDSGYEKHIVSFENGAAQFIQRRVESHSPSAGGRLADIEIPQGLIVAAVLRGGRAIVPRGDHPIAVGDEVILFVSREEVATAHLLFPGPEQG